MSKPYLKGINDGDRQESAEVLSERIRGFLSKCRTPAVLEAGDDLLSLKGNNYELEVRSERLWIHVDCGEKHLTRKILSIEGESVGALECRIHRFGGLAGKLTFLDTARPQTEHRQLAGRRQSFAEQFRTMLQRQFPGWEIEILTSAMDLRRSFSPVFPRARLVRGSRCLAAMACPKAEDEQALLTFALIWFDYVRGQKEAKPRKSPGRVELCLFLPEDAGLLTAQRTKWLDGERVSARFFRFNEHGLAGEIDPRDLGNLDTRLASHYAPAMCTEEQQRFLTELAELPQVGLCPELTGAISIRRSGVEFARLQQGRFLLGLTSQEPVATGRWDAIKEFALNLQQANVPAAPERWLETAVRKDIRLIEPDARLEPVHGQVLTFSARDRDLVDLLAVSLRGRLVVLELKAQEDLHLPLQALDYWMRVWWHVAQGETAHLFPGIPLTGEMPLLRLVAPALSFHSTHETVLRYFAPAIPVERVGINTDWKAKLKVVLRLQGAERPQSEEVFRGRTGVVGHKEGLG